MAAINDVVDLTREGEIAVITLDSPPVNALSAQLRAGIAQAVEQAVADDEAKAIVLTCAGRTFCAGADITEFGKPPKDPSLSAVQAVIEAAPKPVIAAIHGTALGGGLELALSCHYRVAVPSARCGLPEVKLGILPGAGGTQRLPRIVGVEQALEMITSGAHVTAKDAAAMGLFDKLVAEGNLREEAIAFAREVLASGATLKKVRDLDEAIAPARGKPEIFEDFRKKNAQPSSLGFRGPRVLHPGRFEAAVEIKPFEGLKFDAELFSKKLVASVAIWRQTYAFFA